MIRRTIKNVRAFLVRGVTSVYLLSLMVACASDSVETEQPTPISPAVRSDNAPTNSESSQRISPDIKTPTEVCQTSTSAGSENSSGKEGAIIVLPETDQFKDALLLYRLESTGSVLEVRQVVFSFGSYSSGDYTFELHLDDGRSCRVPVSIRPSDIESRIKITLLPTIKEN